MIKNKYITSYFPLLSIVLFSMSLGICISFWLIGLFRSLGVYEGLMTFFSARELTLTLFLLLSFLFFMLFAALKLISDTLMGLSLLFFSTDLKGEGVDRASRGVILFVIGSFISIIVSHSLLFIVITFLATACTYFVYAVYRMHEMFKPAALIGFIFFHVFSWSIFTLVIAYFSFKFYHSMLNSLPV
ncbi:DUF5366 family protein [Bacillus songklensis]|uniref:DUF5366 family protein n=1 Tax=Bacillus songklensis TaxID=1069116 RepID=A0ABV8B977_9BACI